MAGHTDGLVHGQIDQYGQSAPGRVVQLDSSAGRLDEAARHGEPEPDTDRRAGVAKPLEGTEHPFTGPGATPGPRSITRRWSRPCTSAASTRTCDDGGDHASALAMMLASARSRRAGSVDTGGSVSGTVIDTRVGSCSNELSAHGQHN
jgi:hypothetical protein